MTLFSSSHEWVDAEHRVGITDYAQKELGEIVFVELPKVGDEVRAGEAAVILESTKSAADIYAPLSGRVVEVNEAARRTPSLINRAPEKEGWLFRIAPSKEQEKGHLLSRSQYEALFSK